jgi:hypothetical protein
MTAATALAAAFCFALIGIGIWLKRAEEAHARFNDDLHEETSHA